MGQHVLVPVDGSSASEEAFAFALAHHPDSTLTLLHVINPVSSAAYSDDDYFDLEGFDRAVEHRRDFGETLLAELEERATAHDMEVETVVKIGRPAHEILAVAEERQVDQIVMGSRGRSGVGRVLFGSVAEAVTRRSTVPVTIVR